MSPPPPPASEQAPPFFCRQWVFTKLQQCLQHKASACGGALLVGGVGTGKTAVCRELVCPSASSGRQLMLHHRLLAHHFCRAELAASLRPAAFILGLVEQLSCSPLVSGYAEKLRDPDIAAVLTPAFCSRRPEEALRRAVLFPLLELDGPAAPLLLLVDAADAADGVAQLLAAHHHMLPRWLLLVVTCRRASRHVTRLFSGFRKVSADHCRSACPLCVYLCIGLKFPSCNRLCGNVCLVYGIDSVSNRFFPVRCVVFCTP